VATTLGSANTEAPAIEIDGFTPSDGDFGRAVRQPEYRLCIEAIAHPRAILVEHKTKNCAC
jgi:hypothetical protein